MHCPHAPAECKYHSAKLAATLCPAIGVLGPAAVALQPAVGALRPTGAFVRSASEVGAVDLDAQRHGSYPLPPMNDSLATFLCAVLAVAGIFVGTPSARGDELTLKPREGVVLLNNGELLSGTIIPAGDRYDVHLASGEICLRRADVAMICRDAQECYQHKRANIEAGRIQDHLELAEWCLRNGLLDLAERELADARKADHTHPKIRLLVSRLELARQPLPRQTSTTAEKPVSHTTLDSVTRNLPSGTMETFTHSIQPLLLNNCSKSGCHSTGGEGGLKLERIHPRFSARTSTQRNLEQVLALVDRDNPPASKLLQAPIRPHGTVKSAIFTDRQQGQYRQLVQWVYAVAGARSPVEKPTLQERTAPLLQAVPGAAGRPPVNPDELPISTDPLDVPPESLPPAANEAEPLPDAPAAATAPETPLNPEQAYTPEQLEAMGIDLNGRQAPHRGVGARGTQVRGTAVNVQRGAQLPDAFTPQDEFDPNIFNRRFFGK